MEETPPALLYGINTVAEALRSGRDRCYRLVTAAGQENQRVRDIIHSVRGTSVKVETLPPAVFKNRYRQYAHQGIVGYFSPKATLTPEDLAQQALEKAPRPVIVALDNVQDPHNLGAIVRSAAALGVSGVIIPKQRSAPLSEAAAKSSAGALTDMPVAVAGNMRDALEVLKTAGFWVVGAVMSGDKPCWDFAFGDFPLALVIGGEGKGLRPLLRQTCDFTVRIPMTGGVGSFNVSAAAAILLYEIARQKNTAPK